jgi:hypothetical protein
LSGFFVGIAPVIGLIKPASLENNRGTAANQTPKFVLTTTRTFFERFIFNILKFLKFMGTSITTVFVSRHGNVKKICFAENQIIKSL